LGCLGVMLAINLVSSAVAVAVLFGIHQYLRRTAGPARWADSKRSYHFQLMREHLFAIPSEPEHPRDRRPQLLAFSDDPPRRRYLLRFASWIEGGSGLITVVRILVGQGKKAYEQGAKAEAEFQAEIAELGLKSFIKVVVAPDFGTGAQTLFQSFGIGPIHANTILLNGPEQLLEAKDTQGHRQYGRYLSEAFRLGSNIVIFNAREAKWGFVEGLSSQDRRIDVWWLGDATSRLMLLFAYLMTRNDEWNEAHIGVLAPAEKRGTKRDLENLRLILEDVRITAEPEILVKPTFDTVVEQSTEASCVFLPLHVKRNRLISPLGATFEELLSRLSLSAFVIAAEDIDLEAEPEKGKPGETAAALDAAADAEKIANKSEKKAAKSAEQAEEKLRELQEAVEMDITREKLSEMRASSREAEKLAKKAAREAEKAWTDADEAAQSAEVLMREPDEIQTEAVDSITPKKTVKNRTKAKKKKSRIRS
jgi:hypothetical protein